MTVKLPFYFRYLEHEHSHHCVPSNVSSGLAGLPLKYVWNDGAVNMSLPTNPTLPTGEPLDGKKAYSQIMSYFTTNQMTPLQVHELGKTQLRILYPKVNQFSKNYFKVVAVVGKISLTIREL